LDELVAPFVAPATHLVGGFHGTVPPACRELVEGDREQSRQCEPPGLTATTVGARTLQRPVALRAAVGDQSQESDAIDPGRIRLLFDRVDKLVQDPQLGDTASELIAVLTHERPEQFGLSGSLAVMTDAVIGNTFDLAAEALSRRNHEVRDHDIQDVAEPPVPGLDDRRLDAYKFDVEAMSAPLSTSDGLAKTARKQFWDVLENIAMYSLKIADNGMREPHWHPETAEMGYIAKGTGRMTILDPDGTWDTFELHEGDVYYIPRSYPHHIEDIGDSDIHFLIFFDQPMPRDVGYRAAVSALRPEVVAAAFGVETGALPELPFTPADPLIVGRVNPIDPIR
jgi:oxalate decarboxylase